ncbi:adenylate kinase [Candidatus Woesearchaeota archaeon]|nr:MAG: adenylate kinase [Candidatus Woesearchaeota archaeon]
MKRIILLGPQGCGKGTQAKFISEKYEIPHISTGDIFRYNIKNKTELGVEALKYINDGNLVPDDLTNRIVEDRLKQEDCVNGFILDGFPRTIPQADALREMTDIDYVVLIEIPDEDVIFRLEGRRMCSGENCKDLIYNINTSPKPQNEGVCDRCGRGLYQRDDDKVEAIRKRLQEYHEKTSPLIDYYGDKVISIDGTKDIEEVTKDIFDKLD